MGQTDSAQMEILARRQCLDLMGGAPMGRIGLSIDALPVVLPVYFALFDDCVLFRTVAGTKLDAAIIGAVVAFQADGSEPDDGTYWSALVQGVAVEARDHWDFSPPSPTPTTPWGASRETRLVRVEVDARERSEVPLWRKLIL